MSKKMKTILIIIAILALIGLTNSLYTVAENEYACTVRFSAIIKTTDTFAVLIAIEVSISTILYVLTIWLVIRKIRFDKKLKEKMKAKAERLAKKQQKSLAE